ncbi:trypsin-1-like [Oratosquilla oratoria]|uniref:trypsin-1-like n=1 Tax=Oratosquilla oratoria TaxID=337810 RepID=UPI003F76A953
MHKTALGRFVFTILVMRTIIFALLVAGAFAVPTNRPRLRLGLNKIVGGEDATPGEFPYQISFQDNSWGFIFHFCGGSVYNENYIVTAGHCVYGKNYDNPSNLQITAGEHNLDKEEGNEQSVKVEKIILHEDYDTWTVSNDISLLKLAEPLTMNDYVKAIPLETKIASGNCKVTGWGALTEGGSSPSVLQWVTVPIVSDKKCREAYGSSEILDSMLCAGGDGKKDSCQGDSGGPLACDGRLAGVVSWGFGCARPKYPGVYTEVSYFADWVTKHAVQMPLNHV